MTAPQISTETLIASLDHIIDQARDDMRTLARTATLRPLTEDELDDYELFGRTINHQTLQREKFLP
ncbi:hypothetical protein EV641_109156 [Rhodococcus sp. SMB37]|uniref:hypothetical protein n=1 Tax=Rhodococcus sp. SMB37 TaxID=2512213 RepID=UPI001047D7C0|nr:hypothetical protein [Rhodococcus sp. SMB37]TCN51765.1 hypothetical protein EV641_109156 [Rhodococcus sp. SMB37]